MAERYQEGRPTPEEVDRIIDAINDRLVRNILERSIIAGPEARRWEDLHTPNIRKPKPKA